MAYVNDTHNDRHLHLERIGEDQSIVRAVPSRVDTERIYGAIRDSCDDSFSLRPVPARLEDGQGQREDVVVHESGKECKETHEEDDVTTKVEGVQYFVAETFSDSSLKEDEHTGSQRHEESVSDIAEHDGKQERESDDREETRVDLLVGTDTIGIDD